MRRGPKPTKAEVEAELAAARESLRDEASRREQAEKRLAEALDQQTATSEILRVISRSQTDVQPVFDTIVRSAVKLCHGLYSALVQFDGELVHFVAQHNFTPEALAEAHRVWPMRPSRASGAGRAILERAVVQIPDIELDPEYGLTRLSRAVGHRSSLYVPMLREGAPIGVVIVARTEAGPFSDTDIELLKTFADQAVIAIENVRLFTELQQKHGALTQAHTQVTEALDQQTATADILRVISASPTDVEPVFRAIAASATRLCDARFGTVFRYDGELITLAANHELTPEEIAVTNAVFPARATRGTAAGRAIVDRSVVHISDIRSDPDYVATAAVNALGYRTALAVPMLREGSPIGVFVMWRREVRPFADTHIELLKTFADQAVIAIENVRLFKELEARNRDLTEALEQQTATSEILRVISRSQTDVQPVFDTIVTNATRLCDAAFGILARFDGELLTLAAHHNLTGEELEVAASFFPRPATRAAASGRAVVERRVVHIHDIRNDPEYRVPTAQEALGYRTALGVPLLREATPIGVLALWRREVRPFTDGQIELLKTFADQAIIAVENVRLFKELEVRNRDLIEALDQQMATAEILRVISSSPTDFQPVFDTIVRNAAKVCEAFDAILVLAEGDEFVQRAHHGPVEAVVGARYPLRGTVTGRALLEARVIQVENLVEASDYPAGRELAQRIGYRTTLSVPLLRDGVAIGAIGIRRTEVLPFSNKQIALLQTFADQAVIAIENVRLFKELEARNRDLTVSLEQQTATAEVLRIIAAAQADVQPVFDTIAANALRLCVASFSTVFRFDGGLIHAVAFENIDPKGTESILQDFPMPPNRGNAAARAILTRDVVYVRDVREDPEYRLHRHAAAVGFRSVLAVPMLREGNPIGAIAVLGADVAAFSDNQVELLKTFADQAVIAIENARLFNELRERTAELTRSVRQLTALGEVGQAVSSTLDLETVLTTIVSRAVQLAGMDAGAIYEYDEAAEVFHLRATENLPGEFLEIARPLALRKGEGAAGRLAVTREPVQIPDIAAPDAYQSRLRDVLLGLGHRALLAVPLLREDRIVGGLVVNRRQPGEFAPEVIEVLKTFATQSALAIQNARLFREIEEKSRELEAASQHKSEFLANMSHELRTPLNAIIGFSEVLTERMFGDLNEKQDEYLKDISVSGQHLLSLINDILDLSKIEAGRMELELTHFDLSQAISNALTLVRERAGRRSIALHQAVDERLGQIRGDERKIKQVLLNLLSNALKFTPEGGRIDVRASIVDGMAEISVRDTGVGIAPEDQEAVFEEFRQVGTAAKKVEGTGLGLALSRKFIELHGGRIWVESQEGIGSTFTFTLPLTIDQQRGTG